MNNWWQAPCKAIDEEALDAAHARQAQLTKPSGALGTLEALAVRLAGLQGTQHPTVDPVAIAVFAGDHGIASEGVSAYPQSVTGQMLANFVKGGAAINVLARQLDAELEVIDLGLVHPHALPGVHSLSLGPGTANFTREPAMSHQQCEAALDAGHQSANRAVRRGARLFVGGEMGIGNTTSASALACALLERPASDLAGRGTGLDEHGVRRKTQTIERGLTLHGEHSVTPFEALRRLGGFEIAALAGSYIACAQQGVAVLVDGFICSVAALAATRLNPDCWPWLLFAHRSAESGHGLVLAALAGEPLLDLGLRLGEGSGAALAVPLLRHACALHNEMATFAEAAVSERSD